MLEIDHVVDTIVRDEWWELDEIFQECKLSRVVFESILKFLADYGFILTGGSGKRVKVSPSLQKFLEETSTV